MYRYRVAETSTQDRAITLRDGSGRYHLARATGSVPAVGTELSGALPGLGFGILVGALPGPVFRVIFEVVNCQRQAQLERSHLGLTV